MHCSCDAVCNTRWRGDCSRCWWDWVFHCDYIQWAAAEVSGTVICPQQRCSVAQMGNGTVLLYYVLVCIIQTSSVADCRLSLANLQTAPNFRTLWQYDLRLWFKNHNKRYVCKTSLCDWTAEHIRGFVGKVACCCCSLTCLLSWLASQHSAYLRMADAL